MIEKTLLLTLTILFLATFFTRNHIVKIRTGQSIRTRDRLVVSSIVLSVLCFFITISSTSDRLYHFMGVISFLRTPLIAFAGIVLFGISIILAWIISAQLKDSWRVGVHEDQKTSLIKDGIYAYVRNPYFISYYIMYFSLFLIRPSIILMILVLATVALFHRMVLKEEIHLYSMHGTEYEKYKKQTGRYFPMICKKKSI
jgi:protein-S-isoprenylcysteine O-methyltransferase Ste14